ncbi:hypothetical protein KVR01_011720 [Diaporthe batatas]|uniref:uncharacterized protein n=1 Tax=Diaporthe batatas TaxID=748121 RepID=UPI001D049B2F|nr:uncharacterized protein KVR01_011720 [Diaporthe batatas]KAG8158598.1 hypothetical protein KVR01_011720 [Diaporthe batatas]
MRRLISCAQTLFCLASHSSATGAMPRGTERRGSGPKPVDTSNDSEAAAVEQGPVQGTSMNDQELLNDLLGFLDKRMHEDTLSPRRPWLPLEDYCIYAWATHGIVKVLSDDETGSLPKTVEHASDSYLLGAPEIDLRTFI